MMNPKNFRTLRTMCAAAFFLMLSACQTANVNNNNEQVTSVETKNKVSDETFSGPVQPISAMSSPDADDSKNNLGSTEELGTRVRHKKSKRGIASVEEK